MLPVAGHFQSTFFVFFFDPSSTTRGIAAFDKIKYQYLGDL